MGTHPIFESDFDCLTVCSVDLLPALPHDLPDLSSETPVPRSSRSKLKFPTLTTPFSLPFTPGSSPTTPDESLAEATLQWTMRTSRSSTTTSVSSSSHILSLLDKSQS